MPERPIFGSDVVCRRCRGAGDVPGHGLDPHEYRRRLLILESYEDPERIPAGDRIPERVRCGTCDGRGLVAPAGAGDGLAMNESLRERLAAAIYRATYGSTPVGTSWGTVLEMAELPAGAGGGPFRRIRDHALAGADACIAELDAMIEELAPTELAKVDAALEDLERAGLVALGPRLVR